MSATSRGFYIFKTLSFLFIGYLLASFFAREETWVNTSTGEIEMRLELFPFEYKRKKISAFEEFYGRYATRSSKVNWIFVDERYLVPIFDTLSKSGVLGAYNYSKKFDKWN